MWNLENAIPVRVLSREAPVARVAFSPDGSEVLTASGRSVELWDAILWNAEGKDKPLRTLDGHADLVLSAAYDAKGERIVTASRDNTARIWDARTAQETRAPLRHGAPVAAAAFAPDGKRVATVALDGFVRLWDVKAGTVVDTIGLPPIANGADPAEMSVSIDATGRLRIVTRSADARSPRLWAWDFDRKELAESEIWQINPRYQLQIRNDASIEVFSSLGPEEDLARLPAPRDRDPLKSIVISPDGGYLCTLSAGGTVRVVRLPSTDRYQLIRYAREKVVPTLDRPTLSDRERQRLGLGG